MNIPAKAAVAAIAAVTGSLTVLGVLPAQADSSVLSIEYAGRTAPNENGWNNDTVSVRWRCTWDNGYTYDITREVSDEGLDQSVTGTCEQPDGSRVQDTQDQINVDYTAPEVAFLGRTSANAAGWNKTPVSVRWTCTDDRSGVVSETVSRTVSTEGHDQSVAGTCRDLAGNDVTGADVDRISVDLTAPYAERSDTSVPNDAGWYSSDVTYSWTCGDDTSGPAYDETHGTVATDGADQTIKGKCLDKAGNVFEPADQVNVDETAPTITRSSRTPANVRGWNNGPVSLGWTCDDATSGTDNSGDSAVIGLEGLLQAASGTCTDIAGNSATDTVDDVDIDTTAPTLDLDPGPADGASYYFGFVPDKTCLATDTLSGRLSCTVAGYAATVGPHTLTGAATDVAGNRTTAQRSYQVKSWTTRGFYRLVHGRTVAPGGMRSLRFSVFAGKHELARPGLIKARLSQRSVGCTSGAPKGDAKALSTAFTYTDAGTFSGPWTAPATKGCYKLQAVLADGSSMATTVTVD